jgi:hypothetical protein
MNTNKHNRTIGRRVSPNTSRPFSKYLSLDLTEWADRWIE